MPETVVDKNPPKITLDIGLWLTPQGRETLQQIEYPKPREKGQSWGQEETPGTEKGAQDNGSHVMCSPRAGSPRTQATANLASFLCPY